MDFDFKNTVFSFIPNTAEAAFYGLVEGLDKELDKWKLEQIMALGKNSSKKAIAEILSQRTRNEKLVHKDDKQRTFIADKKIRNSMVNHVYDVTYGMCADDKDTLVLLDDSIVRGTTLRDSIVSITARLRPKRIIILSSAPQIRFPDCYGIDMSKMKDFVAFQALLQLLKENGKEKLLKETYQRCKQSEMLPVEAVQNEVIQLYDQFEYCQYSKKIAEIVKPKDLKPQLDVMYQTLDGLHSACPNDLGDWYFSGRYPTPGGNRVANRAFINFMEDKDERAY